MTVQWMDCNSSNFKGNSFKITLILAIYELSALNFTFYLFLSERSANWPLLSLRFVRKCHSSFARKRPMISPFREAIAFSKSTKGSHSRVKWIHVPQPYVMGCTVVNSGSLRQYSQTQTRSAVLALSYSAIVIQVSSPLPLLTSTV